MKRSLPWLCSALACLSGNLAEAFAPRATCLSRTAPDPAGRQSQSSLKMWMPPDHVLASASSFVATIDSDIASIPDDEFGKVFAGGGFIILGSILSTIFVGFMVESGGGYADLVAETYAEQNMEGEESFLDSLGLKSAEDKEEALEMVRSFREKKAKKAGTWTEEEDEEKKQQPAEEKDVFSDYD